MSLVGGTRKSCGCPLGCCCIHGTEDMDNLMSPNMPTKISEAAKQAGDECATRCHVSRLGPTHSETREALSKIVQSAIDTETQALKESNLALRHTNDWLSQEKQALVEALKKIIASHPIQIEAVLIAGAALKSAGVE